MKRLQPSATLRLLPTPTPCHAYWGEAEAETRTSPQAPQARPPPPPLGTPLWGLPASPLRPPPPSLPVYPLPYRQSPQCACSLLALPSNCCRRLPRPAKCPPPLLVTPHPSFARGASRTNHATPPCCTPPLPLGQLLAARSSPRWAALLSPNPDQYQYTYMARTCAVGRPAFTTSASCRSVCPLDPSAAAL